MTAITIRKLPADAKLATAHACGSPRPFDGG